MSLVCIIADRIGCRGASRPVRGAFVEQFATISPVLGPKTDFFFSSLKFRTWFFPFHNPASLSVVHREMQVLAQYRESNYNQEAVTNNAL